MNEHVPPPRSLPRPLLGIVRAREEGKVAGVCAAIGRVTGSDALLWRVLFAVLILFAGAGLIVYALLWLFTPAEGDTAAPMEAVFGRGRSSTPAPLTLALSGGVAVAAFVVFWDNFPVAVIIGLALIGAVVYLTRTVPQRFQRAETYRHSPLGASPVPVPPPPGPPGYRAPFAPYGPYVTYTTQSASHGAATAPAPSPTGKPPFLPPLAQPPVFGPQPQPVSYGTPPQPPVYVPPRPPVVPKPPKPRSKLPLGVLSAIALGAGVTGVVDLAGASVPFGWYLAVALTITAAGLFIATWIGRARSMIAVGIVLSLALGIYSLTAWVNENFPDEDRLWHPTSVAEVQTRYELNDGTGLLDLRDVVFTDTTDLTVTISADNGEIRVRLPQNVDATVTSRVDFGSSTLFGNDSFGGGTRTDLGADGAGGGKIKLNIDVNNGAVEVSR
ncbi:hypothetical protein Afil01_13250 [Actinorhabdospora filicis]|uniref:Phage shock protein PspC N-terminal domain-containing protein n=1 Tax=Actinorhabdospora filicis TaxID=1785913 RepID=A0A9W6SHR8_9ACTN|nr:PspC domain-containing protein [Actinorhabdospora filicis]GLZ76518.1 hypothetical protein Afil01_13250 [Actinorhabdospora filicis]